MFQIPLCSEQLHDLLMIVSYPWISPMMKYTPASMTLLILFQ